MGLPGTARTINRSVSEDRDRIDHMSKPGKNTETSYDPKKSGRQEFLTTLLVWPILTVAFLLLIYAIAFWITEFGPPSFQGVQHFIQGLFSSDHESFNSAPSFAYLGVVIAITIGIAFWLPKEGVSAIPVSSQHIVRHIWSGIVLSTSLLSAFIIAALIMSAPRMDGFLLLISAWFAAVLAGLINLRRPTSELLREAENTRREQINIAAAHGVSLSPTSNAQKSRRVRVKFWLLPLLFSLAPMCALALSLRSGISADAIALGILPVFATLVFQCGWRAKPHYFPGSVTERFAVWISYFVGTLFLAATVLVAFMTGYWAVAIVTCMIWLGVTTHFMTPQRINRSKTLKTIRNEETRNRFQQTNKWLVHLRSEHEKHLREQNPDASNRGNPLIRVELFRRK